MKNTVLNLQDLFLNNARKERIPVTIYLMNGVKVNGQVKGFDSYIIMLEDEKRQQNIKEQQALVKKDWSVKKLINPFLVISKNSNSMTIKYSTDR